MKRFLVILLIMIAAAGFLAAGYQAFHSTTESLPPASRGYLGIVMSFEPAARAHVTRLGIRYVFRVAEVIPGSPAEAAGIRARDVIVRLDGASVPFPDETTPLGSTWRPAQIVKLDIVREADLRRQAEELSIEVPLMDHDEYHRLVERLPKP